MPRRKQPTKEQILARWYAHVKATPSGHTPVLFGGIPAWRIACKRDDIVRSFSLWPVEHWPDWVKETIGTEANNERVPTA